jgi:hypothetical protein
MYYTIPPLTSLYLARNRGPSTPVADRGRTIAYLLVIAKQSLAQPSGALAARKTNAVLGRE